MYRCLARLLTRRPEEFYLYDCIPHPSHTTTHSLVNRCIDINQSCIKDLLLNRSSFHSQVSFLFQVLSLLFIYARSNPKLILFKQQVEVLVSVARIMHLKKERKKDSFYSHFVEFNYILHYLSLPRYSFCMHDNRQVLKICGNKQQRTERMELQAVGISFQVLSPSKHGAHYFPTGKLCKLCTAESN